MASTNFIDGQTPILASWLNDVDAVVYANDDLAGNLAASSGSSLVGFIQAGAGAVATTVQSKLREWVSVFDFMTSAQIADVRSGAATVNVATAVTNAINYCLARSNRLYFPEGAYLITGGVSINNTVVTGWSTLEIEGESFETGSALSQTGYGRGTTFVTDGTSAFLIAFNNFLNESIRFKNVSFYNKGVIGSTSAVIVDKTTVSYPRGWSFEGMGYYNFDTCIALRGNDVSLFNNFFGTMTITRQFPYLCGIGLQLIDAYANLCHIDDSLYFGCSKGGIVGAVGAKAIGSGGIFSVRNTHFEGCEPAGIVAGTLSTFFTLDNTSGEACGVVSGYGIIKRSTTPNALTLTVSNSNYGDKGFSLMPSEYRLGTGDIITASCPVNVSGYGWIATNPAMVTPVVSNNATYNQTDKSTFCLTPVHSNVGRVGARTLDKFGGWNSGANVAYTPPNSAALPDSIRANFVGVTPGVITLANISDTYTAPSSGYVYASWIGKYSAVTNGFSGAQMVINGINVLTNANTFGAGSYNFMVVAPIGSGQVLGRTEIATSGSTTWGTAAYLTFETDLLNMFEAACGHPKSISTQYSLSTAASLTVADYGDGATPFSIRVQLFFNGGKYGFKEYVITGDGALAANRVYTTVASSVVAGIAVTPNSGLNTQLYDITIDNTSGVTVSVTKIVTFIS